MLKYIIFGTFLFPVFLWSQNQLKGKIYTQEDSNLHPVENAEIFWQNTNIFTVSDSEGNFTIPYKREYKNLIISYIGFKTDTLKIDNPHYIEHTLKEVTSLNEITIVQKKKDLHISHSGVNFSETLNKGELLKAACCNLSESFETNPSIDVSFADAVTGIKQIQMLGLSSPYLQFTQENIPAISGANQLVGFGFIPGTWIESIQITKGAGSVINGFESISGQINFELKQPNSSDKWFLNLFGAENGRLELNADYNTPLNEHFSTGFYLHTNLNKTKNDHNKDGFLDNPIGEQINIMNRWNYDDTKNGLHSSLIVRYLDDTRQGGQMNFSPNLHQGSTTFWGTETNINKFDSYFKLGKVYVDLPYKSIGFQANFSHHKQDSYYGLNDYFISENSLYLNLIYQSILSNTYHKFKTGLSFSDDNFNEFLNQIDFSRKEQSIGSFFEYNYDNGGKFSLNAGLRADYHTDWGFFITPRLHVRYQPWEQTTIRASIGNGRRNANIFIENPQIFISNREIEILNNTNNSYGLKPEKALNMGVNFLQTFHLWHRSGTISAEFYRTDFINQVIVDFENARKVFFYNLEGKSFANSFQIGINHEILKGLELRLAYKNTIQKTDYQSGFLPKPLQAQERYFINIAYKTHLTEKNAQWHFDTTLNSVGKMRIPSTSINPEEYQLPSYSKSYLLLNAQINRNFSRNFSLYLGAENLLNKTQKNPIIASDNPFGTYFDGSLIYAPIEGRMLYAGLRFNIKNNN